MAARARRAPGKQAKRGGSACLHGPPRTADTRSHGAARQANRSMMEEAAQRMPPVDVMVVGGACLRARSMVLDDFVRKQENHQHERNYQKRAQDYVFGHNNLQIVKRLLTYCSRHATDCTVGEHLLPCGRRENRCAENPASGVPAPRAAATGQTPHRTQGQTTRPIMQSPSPYA